MKNVKKSSSAALRARLTADILAVVDGGDATDNNQSNRTTTEDSNQNSGQHSHQTDAGNTVDGSYQNDRVTDSYGSRHSDQVIDSGKVFEGPVNSGGVSIS